MPDPLIQILKEQHDRQKKDTRYSDEYRVCGGPSTLRDSSISNHNNRIAKNASLPHIRIHDFRHTHATILINEGINIKEISRRLGHANVDITWRVYAHLYPREEERAIAVLNSI